MVEIRLEDTSRRMRLHHVKGEATATFLVRVATMGVDIIERVKLLKGYLIFIVTKRMAHLVQTSLSTGTRTLEIHFFVRFL